MIELSREVRAKILKAQQNEINEHFIYAGLARSMVHDHNRQVLEQISQDELRHYEFWKKHSGQEVKPDRWAVWKYRMITRVFGLTFGLRLMERGEAQAQVAYQALSATVPETAGIIADEDAHEQSLIGMLDEDKLKYVGSVVLGLSDALVEFTGALAGYTLALQNARLIALVGLVTGVAASLSMAASEYLSTKSEEADRSPLKSSVYTGIAYIFTVAFLICPYLIFVNFYLALAITLVNAMLVILLFTYYISVAKNLPFGKRFLEMAAISLSVAALSFAIGYLIRKFFKIDI